MLNVLYPGIRTYTDHDTNVGAHLYLAEAIRSGITTVVNNEGGRLDKRHRKVLEASKMFAPDHVFID